MRTLLAKEFREGLRTWRFVILAAVLAVSGLMSPLLAYYTPQLFKLIPDLPANFANLIPQPTLTDAIVQYVKNVSQFGVLLLVILTMSAVAAEKERGTAAMLLVRPVQRSSVVLAKWVVWAAAAAVGLLIAALLCLAYTTILFQLPPLGPFAVLNLLMLGFLLVYLSVSLLASAVVRTQAAAAGLAFGGLALLLILSSLPRIGEFMPAQLMNWGAALVLGQSLSAWPALAIAAVIVVGSVTVACARLQKEEI